MSFIQTFIEENGGFIDSRISPTALPHVGGGFGLVVKKDTSHSSARIPAGSILIQLPHSLLLTPSRASELACMCLGYQDSFQHLTEMEWLVLALALLRSQPKMGVGNQTLSNHQQPSEGTELSLLNLSFWISYAHDFLPSSHDSLVYQIHRWSLPPPTTFKRTIVSDTFHQQHHSNHTCVIEQEAYRLLSHLPSASAALASAWRGLLAVCTRVYHHWHKRNPISTKLACGERWEACQWAYATVVSRGFFHPLETWVICPWMCYLNHSEPDNTTVDITVQNQQRGIYSIATAKARCPLIPGQELCISYGRYNDLDWALWYGFVPCCSKEFSHSESCCYQFAGHTDANGDIRLEEIKDLIYNKLTKHKTSQRWHNPQQRSKDPQTIADKPFPTNPYDGNNRLSVTPVSYSIESLASFIFAEVSTESDCVFWVKADGTASDKLVQCATLINQFLTNSLTVNELLCEWCREEMDAVSRETTQYEGSVQQLARHIVLDSLDVLQCFINVSHL